MNHACRFVWKARLTSFSVPQLITAAFLALGAVAGQAAASDLFKRMDRFDQADRADLAAVISRANNCIRARDFNCVDQQVQAATKLAFSSAEKQQIATVKQAAAAEKKTMASEEAAERSREQSARNAALLELCQRSCPIASQAYMCVGGSRTPESCDASQADYEARTAGNSNVGDAVRAAGASVLAGQSRISRIHNDAMANIQAQQNDRLRREQDQRAREQDQRARGREQQQRASADQQAREQQQRAREQQEVAQRTADRQARERQLVAAAAANPGRSPATAAQAAVPGKAANPRESDEDGCIEAIGWCSTPPALEMKGRTALLRFKNTCPFRVYGNFYNGLSDGRVDDGASGVAPGNTYTWSSQDGSGRSFIRVIGSTQSGKDWVCQGKKFPGFTAGDSTLER